MYDFEADRARLGRSSQQSAHHPRPAICEHRRPVTDEMLAEACNFLPALLCALHKELAIRKEVVPYRSEVIVWCQVQARGAVERGDQVALEEVCARRER